MEIRIPIELFKGKESFPLKLLGDIVKEAEKFFKMLGEDIQIEQDEGEWLITDVKGGSLTGTAFRAGVPDIKATAYLHHFKHILEDPMGKQYNGIVSRRTRRQYANIAKNLNPGDAVNFGLIDEKHKTKWHPLSKEISLEIIENIDKDIEYCGTIQGIIHDLQKENKPYYFSIREISSQNLIKCIFHESVYNKVWEILKNRTGIVYVSGLITANQADEKIEFVRIDNPEDIMLAPEYHEGDLENFIGCCPDLIGKKTLQQWIDEVRDREQ